MKYQIKAPLQIYKFSGEDCEGVSGDLSQDLLDVVASSIEKYGNNLTSRIAHDDDWGKKINHIVIAPMLERFELGYYGFVDIDSNELLSHGDKEGIMHFLLWELSDGWGEGFSQEDLYRANAGAEEYINVHYWNSENWNPQWAG